MRIGIVTAAVVALLAGLATAAGGSVRVASAKTPQFAYSKGGATSSPSVWVGRAGKKPKRLGAGDLPMISPNGKLVAVSEFSGSVALKLFATTGGKVHNFFNASSMTATPLAWSGDSRYLAVDLETENGSHVTASVAVIDTMTMTSTVVAKGFVEGASFAPAGVGSVADELVYAIMYSQSFRAKVNLHTVAPNGTGSTRITTDGRSLDPVWGRKGIVFDHERLRGNDAAPAYQLWLKHGSKVRQLTHMKIGQLVDGLVPMGVSSNGNRLIAAYEGEDTYYAWRVQISPLRVSQVKVKGAWVQPGAISRNGGRLLIDQGAFEQSLNHGSVEWVPFGGGRAHKLARGANPSWDE